MTAYLWGWFVQLNRFRGSNGFGPSAISARDLLDWSELKRIDLKPWEIETLCLIDQIFMEESQKSTK